MKLTVFKTLWGHEGSYHDAIQSALDAGFNGIEGPLPQDKEDISALQGGLQSGSIRYIAELCTGGSYVPDREASMQQHLDDVKQCLDGVSAYNAEFITCLGGCDAWPLDISLQFYDQAMTLAKTYDVTISFETHRGRSLFNPWITQQVIDALPEIRLTCDFSHWCVVCERLVDTEIDIIKKVAQRAHHIHARVGYDQGAQVPHPAAPEYKTALQAHQRWWELIWESQMQRGYQKTTMTPEFGPDGYLHTLPFTNLPVADLWQINCWMQKVETAHFEAFLKDCKVKV